MADAPTVPTKTVRGSRPGVSSLPGNVRRSFSEEFIPTVIEEVGCSTTPWANLNVTLLQECMDLVYDGLEYTVEKGDAVEASVGHLSPLPPSPTLIPKQANGRIMTFRNAIATAALTSVQKFVTRFKTPDHIEKYVKSAIIHYGEIPFIYRVFEPTSVRSKKEKSGYKVVSPPLSPSLNQTHHR